ncbi:MAG: M6 family metalloprotease domain-containing protein, partial [Anaerolineae bacterium]|nr:M6 family metalloprotease domain-containing protein [Anaerolineae bacterium]
MVSLSCVSARGAARPQLIAPHPGLMAQLFARYRELIAAKRLPGDMTFEQFFAYWASKRRGEDLPGIDDGVAVTNLPADAPQLIDRPPMKLHGEIRTLVLLVDFPDCPAQGLRNPAFYQRMLFGCDGEFPTGSMRDFYRCASNYAVDPARGIDITGEVHGWLRLPQALEYYAGGGCGTLDTYPRNSQGMAVDAVAAALEAGVDFAGYDALHEGAVTALFIVHAGPGAELSGDANHIWSHKWVLPEDVHLPTTTVKTYLTVDEECNMGVCAHEWGHLAARWADFYDTGSHNKSNGLGRYCLMASGAWGDGGMAPTLPTGMLRMFHDWVDVEYVDASRNDIELTPASQGGAVVVIQNPATMTEKQYVLVEYRRRSGCDRQLPDEGIAV